MQKNKRWGALSSKFKLLQPREGDIACIKIKNMPAFVVWESNEKHDADHSQHYLSPEEALTYPSPVALIEAECARLVSFGQETKAPKKKSHMPKALKEEIGRQALAARNHSAAVVRRSASASVAVIKPLLKKWVGLVTPRAVQQACRRARNPEGKTTAFGREVRDMISQHLVRAS